VLLFLRDLEPQAGLQPVEVGHHREDFRGRGPKTQNFDQECDLSLGRFIVGGYKGNSSRIVYDRIGVD
jgi:hypothetical protein